MIRDRNVYFFIGCINESDKLSFRESHPFEEFLSKVGNTATSAWQCLVAHHSGSRWRLELLLLRSFVYLSKGKLPLLRVITYMRAHLVQPFFKDRRAFSCLSFKIRDWELNFNADEFWV